MTPTNDQYLAIAELVTWYRKAKHQFIELSGIIGTGRWETISTATELLGIDQREIIYLGHDQKWVTELAYLGYHTYYFNTFVYKYQRSIELHSLPVINPASTGPVINWRKKVRSKVDPRYHLIVVLDAGLLTSQAVRDLGGFGLPVILVRDPMLPPVAGSYALDSEPGIQLRELKPERAKEPLVHFSLKALRGEKLPIGNYDNVTILPRKAMNIFNLKSSEMNLTLSEDMRETINDLYRERVLKQRSTGNLVGERLIVTRSLWGERLVNPDNEKLRLTLAAGMVGHLTKLNRHALGTRYVPCEFQPDGYHASFPELYLDRYALNRLDPARSSQERPDSGVLETQYAYALSATMARLCHWDKVTLVVDDAEPLSPEIRARLMYLAMTRARKYLTVIT